MDQVLTVSEFNALLNQTLEFAYPQVVIEGEVSSLRLYGAWSVFLDLKDAESILNCYMAKQKLVTELEDGMTIRATGRPVLRSNGRFSFNIEAIELVGEGNLRRAFELLKGKLEREGLFAAERKRALPEFPRRIGLVTSEEAAAYQDFRRIITERWRGVEVNLARVQVQGARAAGQIARALEYFNKHASAYDVVVLVRGGGSLEDLEAFNSEVVARAIYSLKVPVVVGVGHETDVTIADLVADRRATTPTNAASLVVPDRDEVENRIAYLAGQCEQALLARVAARAHAVDLAAGQLRLFVGRPRDLVQSLERRITGGIALKLNHYGREIEQMERLLEGLSPRRTLARGYSITTVGGRVVKASRQVKSGETAMIQLAEGKLTTVVESVIDEAS